MGSYLKEDKQFQFRDEFKLYHTFVSLTFVGLNFILQYNYLHFLLFQCVCKFQFLFVLCIVSEEETAFLQAFTELTHSVRIFGPCCLFPKAMNKL